MDFREFRNDFKFGFFFEEVFQQFEFKPVFVVIWNVNYLLTEE